MSQTKSSESLIIKTITELVELLSQEPSTTQSTPNSTNRKNNNGSNTDNTGNNGDNTGTDGNNGNGSVNNNNGDNKGNNGNDNNGNTDNTGNNGSVNNNTGNDNTGNTGNNNKGTSSGNDDNNSDGNNCQIQELCERIWALLCKGKNNQNGKENNSNKSSGPSSYSHEKLRKNLDQIKVTWIKLREIEEGDLGKQIQTQLDSLKKFIIINKKTASTGSGSSSTPQTDEFEKFNKEINKLKHRIPSLKNPTSVGSGANQISQLSNGSNPLRTVNGLRINPHGCESFKDSSFYKEIEQIFNGLDPKKKFFLSCFAVFPENEVVKRRLLIYWWVGEGSVKITEDKAPEEIIDEYLEEFKEKGLIEPANKDPRKSTKSYRMHPLVRSAVIILSKDAGYFKYDSRGNLTENLSPESRACLVKPEGGGGYSKQVSENKAEGGGSGSGSSKQMPENNNLDQKKVKTLFNINESYPDLKLGDLSKAKDQSVADWLLKMEKVEVLYLGRWQKSAEYHHIEVESTEFLKGLRSMKELKLLSLQGISRINELPSSIGKLSNLMILDLKACHNLEVLPDEISSLKQLRYMDVSYCYLLDHMPRGLSSLSELQVLKGFVVVSTQTGKKGTLDDLKGLQKLRKLSINNSSQGFPTSKDLEALQHLGRKEGPLRKLTIAWGALQNVELPKKQETNKCCPKLAWGGGSKQGIKRRESNKSSPVEQKLKTPPTTAANYSRRLSIKRTPMSDPVEPKLPEELEKLDLQCFPEPTPPSWLNLGNLKSLKKLYVRGGRLKTLENHKWSEVDTLCLKFLSEFKMNWRELQEKFPKLSYLEKVQCPKITFCPCDENGVWQKPEQIE